MDIGEEKPPIYVPKPIEVPRTMPTTPAPPDVVPPSVPTEPTKVPIPA